MHLAALQGDAMVTLAVREARHAVRVDTGNIGKIEAPHATAIGKAMLAWLPEDEMRRILVHGMKRFTDKTITEFPALVEALRLVRRTGYADRPRGIPARRHLRRRRDPRSGRRGDRRDQRLDAEPCARATSTSPSCATRSPPPTRALSAEFGGPGAQPGDRPQAVAV